MAIKYNELDIKRLNIYKNKNKLVENLDVDVDSLHAI